MNIGIDIRSLMSATRTGVSEYTYELLSALFLADQENRYFLFCNRAADVAKYIPQWRQKNVNYIATQMPNKLFNSAIALVGQPKLDSFILKKSISLLKTKKMDWWFSPNLNFTAVSKRTRQILTIHDLAFAFFPDCFTRKQRLWHRVIRPHAQCERATLILTPSENTKLDVVEYYGLDEKKVRVIYPGLSSVFRTAAATLEQVRQRYNLPDKYLLFLGTIEPRKNVEAIIDAFILLRQNNPLLNDYHLILAGPMGWDTRGVRERLACPNTRYIDYVSASDKPGLYRGAKAFIYPSLYEGFGFPALEAMSCGVPVVTSSRSSLPEVAGEAAYLVNPMNLADIAQGMSRVLMDQPLRESMIARGYERAKQFRWEIAAKNFLNLL